jgi:hypothetical protein
MGTNRLDPFSFGPIWLIMPSGLCLAAHGLNHRHMTQHEKASSCKPNLLGMIGPARMMDHVAHVLSI